MIVDRQGRRFRNLRISLTSACNYACTYCVPDGKRLVAAQDELSAEAMARGVAYLIEAAGIERLRITGGEPLVSPKLEAFMGAVGQMGLSDISLTTNGQLLARKLPLLVAAGIRRINVSLDTLDADAFRSIARGGDLVTVLDGMDQASAAGIKIKVNILDREARLAAIAELCKVGKADLVQVIGKMALLYRKNFSVNKQLSNVHRFK